MPTKYSSIRAVFVLLVLFSGFTDEDSVAAFPFVGHAATRSSTSTSTSYRKQKEKEQLLCRMKPKASGSDRHDYYLEPNSDPTINAVCTFTEEQIHLLIARRLDCKKRRNFEDADRILEALNKNGIYIQDKARKYRVDGEKHFGRRKHYVQRGGNNGSIKKEDLALIGDLVEERARCKRQKDFYRSDEITDLLKEKHGVRVDDKRREWSFAEKTNRVGKVVAGGADAAAGGSALDDDEESSGICYYVPTPLASKDHPTHTMEEDLKEQIRDRLSERSIARKSKKYKLADRILQDLMDEYSIVVDDRTKEWKVVGENDPFAREAELSQRSAFVQSSRRSKGPSSSSRNNNRNSYTNFHGDTSTRSSSEDDDSGRRLSFDDEMSRIITDDDNVNYW